MAENQYEREIDELLRRLDAEQRSPLPFRARRSRRSWNAAWQRVTRFLGPPSMVERLMAVSVILLLATFVLGFVVPRLAWTAAMLAVATFVAALALSVWNGAVGRGRTGGYEQPHGYSANAVDWNGLHWRLRRWWRRLRG